LHQQKGPERLPGLEKSLDSWKHPTHFYADKVRRCFEVGDSRGIDLRPSQPKHSTVNIERLDRVVASRLTGRIGSRFGEKRRDRGFRVRIWQRERGI